MHYLQTPSEPPWNVPTILSESKALTSISQDFALKGIKNYKSSFCPLFLFSLELQSIVTDLVFSTEQKQIITQGQ